MLKAYGTTWRFNQFTILIELDGEPVAERDMDLLYVILSMRGWQATNNHAIDVALKAAYLHSFDPFRDYLDRIASDDRVDPADLNKIATTHLDTKDDLYDATLIGAVARTYEPGSMFKTALTLKGGQDIGKSSVIKKLASLDWVCDSSQESTRISSWQFKAHGFTIWLNWTASPARHKQVLYGTCFLRRRIYPTSLRQKDGKPQTAKHLHWYV